MGAKCQVAIVKLAIEPAHAAGSGRAIKPHVEIAEADVKELVVVEARPRSWVPPGACFAGERWHWLGDGFARRGAL
jgi:hypothetical protein